MNGCTHIGLDVHNLARLHSAGELTSVRVRGAAEEAVRDLVRVREEATCDRRIARQRIRSFLLRYGKRYPGPRDAWSQRFEVWARSLSFDEPLAQEAFANLLSAYFIRDTQLAEMGRRVEEIAGTEPFAEGVARLSALRDISTLTAMTPHPGRDVRLRTLRRRRKLHGLHRAHPL